MGGGGSLFASPEWKKDPREIFNSKLLLLGITIAFAGCSYGFDQGNIGGIMTFPSFRKAFGFDTISTEEADKREGNIAAMLAAGGTAGALLAAPLSDYLGRKKAVTSMAGLFLIGCSMQEVPNLDVLYAGRLLAGVAIGATSMLAPQYLAENSPKSIRGSLTTSYNLMIILALAIAFWVNYAVSLWPNQDPNNNKAWQLALGIQLIPGFFLFVLIWFVVETPRALIAKGKDERGLKNLCKLRGLPAEHPYVRQEYMEITAQVEAEQVTAKGTNYLVVMKDIGTNASNRRRLFLAIMLFLFHKLTGTDSLNYFAPQIFAMIGVPKGSSSLLTTGVYGVVKLATTIVYVTVIVDRVGRRLPLIIGATIQATAMLYIGLFIRFSDVKAGSGTTPGGIVGIIMIYLYAFGWSFGHSVAPYLTAAEIFPARIRSFCMSCCLFTNWIVNYGITSATPHMLRTMGYGTFLFFAVMTYIGAIFVFFCLPEMKGRSIESMDDLFQHSLWSMFKRAYPTEEEKVRHDVQERLHEKMQEEEKDVSHVAMVEDNSRRV
ncbi:putative quinate permease [Colletotrichum sp. SAR 10_70]|uniref:putative quinate permease n=1 Tax=Colletotrichum siamense TaxID=690259 RepID=UPI00187272C0|nr:putative quinate permease [Colletotrichum siamense]KAI8165003.1 putative quinate permease [Colletotrichum sp. SAR 10_71]KAI8172666.1 putative quinate permease [Colletotrichum sp. SAR 10_70]KAI8183788.1 putative quinate permease [Colletotrichum sp. SAR 10_75]KAI8209063.1 putative quinate permease [Colletotrichum sp. SAR 10_65]KAF5510857.1 putative quinate permease [Colletotrichum siamense]